MAIEQYHKLQDSVAPGGAVGILLSGTRPGDVKSGDLLIALPGACGNLKDIQIPQFRMHVDGFFTIEGRGPVVTGWVHGARIRVGNPVAIVRADGTQRTATVRGIEHNQQLLDCAHPGDAVGILLFGVHETEVGVGDWLVYFDW